LNDQALDDNRYHGPTPPVEPPPARGERVWVERPDELAAAVERLASAAVVAVDAEFMQVRATEPEGHRHQLALLQIATGQVCYVIDVLRLADLTPLAVVTEESLILKLFHGIGADTLARRGLAAASTCDVEAASRSIFGQRESGLATMLERAFGLRLDKSLQRSDWGHRPLSPAMFAYAARDAEMTLALYDWLKRHYPWAIDLYTESGSSASADTARLPVWLEPFVDGARSLPPEVAVAEAGLADDVAGQVRDCALALSVLRHPARRSRLMRLISDLGLVQLAPQMLPVLVAPAAEERAAAARTLGRLVRLGAPDVDDAPERLMALNEDPVAEVRKAARLALDWLSSDGLPSHRYVIRRPGEGPASWTVGAESDEATTAPADDWRAALLGLMPASDDEQA
jgi:hypothetical protein